MTQRLVFIVDSLDVSTRLDKFLAQQQSILSRSRAEFLINSGLVKVNAKTAKSSYKMKLSDTVEVNIPVKTPTLIQPLDFKLDIVFEDADLLVINKPSGLVVHPAAGHRNDTLVNALLAYTKDLSMKFGEDRPGIVHRIDKETSGLLVVAKNDRSHQNLSAQFKQRSITRLYEAVCAGTPRLAEAKVTSVIARHPTHRKRFASLRDTTGRPLTQPLNDAEKHFTIGKIAITSYQVLKNRSTASLIELKLFTGRTHQIRVHMAELGHPLLGDKLYSNPQAYKKISAEMKMELDSLNRFLLHAKVLGFVHPLSKQYLHFEVDWPTQDKVFIEKWFK